MLYIFFVSMCVPWELNPQPFVLLTQCSTTEPQEHIIKVKTHPALPKTPNSNMPPHVYVTMLEDLHKTAQICLGTERRHNFYSYFSIVAAPAMSWRGCVFLYMVRGVTFPSQAWGIRPITTQWIADQSEHTTLFRTMSLVKINAF